MSAGSMYNYGTEGVRLVQFKDEECGTEFTSDCIPFSSCPINTDAACLQEYSSKMSLTGCKRESYDFDDDESGRAVAYRTYRDISYETQTGDELVTSAIVFLSLTFLLIKSTLRAYDRESRISNVTDFTHQIALALADAIGIDEPHQSSLFYLSLSLSLSRPPNNIN